MVYPCNPKPETANPAIREFLFEKLSESFTSEPSFWRGQVSDKSPFIEVIKGLSNYYYPDDEQQDKQALGDHIISQLGRTLESGIVPPSVPSVLNAYAVVFFSRGQGPEGSVFPGYISPEDPICGVSKRTLNRLIQDLEVLASEEGGPREAARQLAAEARNYLFRERLPRQQPSNWCILI